MKSARVVLILLLAFGGLADSANAHGATSVEGDPFVRVDRSIVVATSSAGNTYVAGASVIAASPGGGDLTALGGTVVVAAPLEGDAFLLSGSGNIRAPIEGDVRALAGRLDISRPIGGDLSVLAASLHDSAHVAGNVVVAALEVVLTDGARGSVNVYGNSVTIGGEFERDVHIVAGDRLTLLPGTVIRGALVYEAPVPAAIPEEVEVRGGITYTVADYLPGAGVSKTLAMASIGIFLLARILASLILAGLLTGLFPKLAEAVIGEAYGRRARHVLLTILLGFAAFVATPILVFLLALTLVGFGVAILLGIMYALLILLSLVYAGITLGGFFARRFLGRDEIRWADGVLGTLVLSIIGLIPVIGLVILLVGASFAAGALLSIFFRSAFSSSLEGEML